MKTRLLFWVVWLGLAGPGWGQNWDIDLLKGLNPDTPHPMDMPMLRVSQSVAPLAFLTAASLGTAGLIRDDRTLLLNGLETGTAVAGQTLISLILKHSIDRDRPYVTYPNAIRRIGSDFTPSFPSGHTGTAFALATSLSLQYPKWYIIAPAATYAALAGYSRMHLGAHYPSDVLAGAVLGAGMAVGSHFLRRSLSPEAATVSLAAIGAGSGLLFVGYFVIARKEKPAEAPALGMGMQRRPWPRLAYRTRTRARSLYPPSQL